MGGKPRQTSETQWRVYLVECSDGSLYTGIAVNVDRRIEQHNRGQGARYTRGRGPVRLLAQSDDCARGDALRLEYRIKQLRPPEKRRALLDLSNAHAE